MTRHRDKLRMARKMMTQEEITRGISPFNSEAWNKRKIEIQERVKKDIEESRKNKTKQGENGTRRANKTNED